MVHVAKISFQGDPNVGLHCAVSDKVCLIGKNASEKLIKELEEIFQVPVLAVSVYGTSLLGIFASVCKNTILLPEILFDYEIKDLKEKASKVGVKVEFIKTDNTALGNNILCNDKVAFVSSNFTEAEVKKISDVFGVKTLQVAFAETTTPGAFGVLTNKAGVFSQSLSDEEIARIEKEVGFEVGLGTINMGSPIIHAGVVANSNGFIVGDLSSGFEIGRVDESLGFLKP